MCPCASLQEHFQEHFHCKILIWLSVTTSYILCEDIIQNKWNVVNANNGV